METTLCGIHVAALIILIRTRPAIQRAPSGQIPTRRWQSMWKPKLQPA